MTPIDATTETLLDTRAAAAILNVSENTMKNYRSQNRGPAFYNIEGNVKYSVRDLNAYLESARVSTTDQE